MSCHGWPRGHEPTVRPSPFWIFLWSAEHMVPTLVAGKPQIITPPPPCLIVCVLVCCKSVLGIVKVSFGQYETDVCRDIMVSSSMDALFLLLFFLFFIFDPVDVFVDVGRSWVGSLLVSWFSPFMDNGSQSYKTLVTTLYPLSRLTDASHLFFDFILSILRHDLLHIMIFLSTSCCQAGQTNHFLTLLHQCATLCNRNWSFPPWLIWHNSSFF